MYVCFLFIRVFYLRVMSQDVEDCNNILIVSVCIAAPGKGQRRRTVAVTGFLHLPSQRRGSMWRSLMTTNVLFSSVLSHHGSALVPGTSTHSFLRLFRENQMYSLSLISSLTCLSFSSLGECIFVFGITYFSLIKAGKSG